MLENVREIKKQAIYLRRKADDELVRWKSREDRFPLLLKGARQVGKTECVRHFADGRYASFIEINFVERPEFKEIVRDGFSVETLIASTNYKDITWGVKLVHGNVGFENSVLTLPQWCAFLLPRVVGGT